MENERVGRQSCPEERLLKTSDLQENKAPKLDGLLARCLATINNDSVSTR